MTVINGNLQEAVRVLDEVWSKPGRIATNFVGSQDGVAVYRLDVGLAHSLYKDATSHASIYFDKNGGAVDVDNVDWKENYNATGAVVHLLRALASSTVSS